MDVFTQITSLLDKHGIKYEPSIHAPVRTSQEAAKIRGVDIKTGAKAMVVRSEGRFMMFILPASERVDFGKIKKLILSDSVSLATPDEVLEKTGCVVGCVPPFGSALFGMKTYVDPHLLLLPEINFSAGLLTHSIKMKTADWKRIVEAEEGEFCKKIV